MKQETHPKWNYYNKAFELDLKPTIKLIVLRIINRISTPNKGEATQLISYPGANDLLKVLHCSERQLRRYLKELRALDLFTFGSKAVTTGTVNTYTINPKCALWMDENPLNELSNTMTARVNTMTHQVQHHDTLGPNTMTPQVQHHDTLGQHHDRALSCEYSPSITETQVEVQEEGERMPPPASVVDMEQELARLLEESEPSARIPETASLVEPEVGLTPDTQNLQPRSPGMCDLQLPHSQRLTPVDTERVRMQIAIMKSKINGYQCSTPTAYRKEQ